MIPNATLISGQAILYPDSDGKPMADNTLQLQWIVALYVNLAAMFRDRDDVFVAADLLWYPVEGQPEVRIAPDVLVAFGRPRGHRGSYKQWEEGDVPLTVVFEILSPSNTFMEMENKHAFYEEHGVEEYYIYDPDHNWLSVFGRRGDVLKRMRPAAGFVSPRLGIRFDLSGAEMGILGPDGKRFLTGEELKAAHDQAAQRAEQAEQRAGQAEQRATRLAELSRKARRGHATTEELQELDRLEEQASPPPP